MPDPELTSEQQAVVDECHDRLMSFISLPQPRVLCHNPLESGPLREALDATLKDNGRPTLGDWAGMTGPELEAELLRAAEGLRDNVESEPMVTLPKVALARVQQTRRRE